MRAFALRPSIASQEPSPFGNSGNERVKSPLVQAKLRIGAPDDRYERVAERVADLVMREPKAPLRSVFESSGPSPLAPLQRQCVACQGSSAICPKCSEEETLQRQPLPEEDEEVEVLQAKAAPGRVPEIPPDLPARIESLRGTGQSLPLTDRTFFERRFGFDFSKVRIHADRRAEEAARSVQARAFTVGRNVVFAAGQYAPGTGPGRRLLAHELTHVVQQQAGLREPSPLQRSHGILQRAPNDSAESATERKDLVILLTGEDFTIPEAQTIAPAADRIRVETLEEMAKALAAVKFPIRTLFIISHSLTTGDLGFDKGSTRNYERPEKVATALMGQLSSKFAPNLVDFRGCSLGSSPEGMNQIRTALGAGAATAGNCYTIVHPQGPVTLDGKKITNSSQVSEKDKGRFATGLQLLIDSFGFAKNCILDTSQDAYFRTGGKLVAMWSSPEFQTEWDARKSKCFNDLELTTVNLPTTDDFSPGLAGHCKLIRVEKPQEVTPANSPAPKKIEPATQDG